MWFSLFAAVLILAITFYQGLLGLFSSVINFFLAALAAALAFGLYEDVYFTYLIDRQPDFGRAIALMAIFIISLLVMRVIVDLAIKDNMRFSLYVDRLGGGAFGFFFAMIVIGTAAVAIQMLPFPHEWLGFSRYALFEADSGEAVSLTPEEERQTEADMLAKLDVGNLNFVRKSIWFNPDGFTLALVSHLSENALAGSNSFGRINPDLLDELHWARFNTLGQKTDMARKLDAIQVQACWELPEDQTFFRSADEDKRNQDKITLVESSSTEDRLPAGFRWLAVRVKLSPDATDDGTNCRFTANQVRLVTRSPGGRTQSHYLLAIDAFNVQNSNPLERVFYRLAPAQSIARPLGRAEFVFEVPEDAEPWFIEFRRNARAGIRGIDEEAPPLLDTAGGGGSKKNANQQESGGPQRNKHRDDGQSGRPGTGGTRDVNRTGNPGATDGRIGRVARVHSDLEGSFWGTELPFELTSYAANGVEVQGDRIIGGGGRIVARLDADNDDEPIKGSQNPIRRFDVPRDQRLLHLSVTRLQPGSLYGQVKDFAAQNQNVYVEDSDLKRHPAVGMWAIATVGRERLLEICFFDETTRMSSAAVPKLDRIRRDNLRNNYELYYLFEVPPGTKIEKFINPNGREESYGSVELVAPR